MNTSARQPERGASGRLASLGRLRFRVPPEAHFWVILGIMACGTLLYYADSIPWIETVEPTLRLDFTRRSIHRILSILPVAYAAAVFGLQGGLLASFVIGALLLPRVFFVSSEHRDALVEVIAFVFIGAFVSWLIDIQLKEKARHGQTIASLEQTQQELQSHIELQRQTADQLRQSEESYRGLFENATEAIFVLDLRGKIIAANRACEKLTGLTSAELVGMDSGSFLSGESLATVGQVVERQVRGEATEGPIELRLTRRDGTQATVELMPNVIVRGDEPV